MRGGRRRGQHQRGAAAFAEVRLSSQEVDDDVEHAERGRTEAHTTAADAGEGERGEVRRAEPNSYVVLNVVLN